MQHDFTVRTEISDCIGSEVLIRGDFPVSEVSLVLQAGHSHCLNPALGTTYLQAIE